ncbi:uncharacterized protein Z520_03508 [Fonsecaea multimorphosa CBS 102226]|uniref:Exonuclease domain-containing protein n=1 Tax=Fonsecaea multimorphosa CBS 102226 TaxID=1442371 RepID=A0A0D2IUV1_9EURO|nr:uncharacterized protein Z520_03508 [Fonsecaea multimorphosa CBS 102226]KIY00842.1 hypothetical protein Z520_03508 [Fonsecaea multimorphosa CBS 102226]OAL27671.1 hypothetical protein AYO22_03337 [Fonsecaea multimorphosa]
MALPNPSAWPSNEATEPNAPQFTWSAIGISTSYLEKLRLLCHSQKELQKAGYVTQPLDATQIESKARCTRCGKRPRRRVSTKPVITDAIKEHKRPKGLTGVHTEEAISEETLSTSTSVLKKKASAPCSYHTGVVSNKAFTCCGKHVSTEGCMEAREHTMPRPDDPLLQEYWQYHPTPSLATQSAPATNRNPVSPGRGSRRQGHKKGRQQQPQQQQQQQQQQQYNNPHPFYAIALDCEMGVSATGDSELIRLTAVDFFSGAVLIDNLVAPSVAMMHYNTRYSGVTARDMREAIKSRTAIFGRDCAREALLRLLGPDTVVVVHGGSNDLSALRWIHPLIIDTYILEGYTGVHRTEGGRSLQNLCKVKLGIAVQVSGPQSRRDDGAGVQTQTQTQRRRKGHDSYEDAMAARELVVHWATRIPDA